MSIAFILRMIPIRSAVKADIRKALMKRLSVRKSGRQKGYTVQKYVRKMNWENWTVSVSLSWQGI